MTSSPLANPSGHLRVPETDRLRRNPTIEDFNFPPGLPTADDLPCSDDKPVDSILQELIPGLLKNILLDIWQGRTDWLFGIDLGFYYDPKQPAVAPDGMLCLGVKDYPDENLRPSYVLWNERVIPLFVMEVISKTTGGERTKKMDIYESVGILYYLIYAPLLKKKARFQIYKLIGGEYVLQSDGQQPYWMPEIALGIGVERFNYSSTEREWLFWYNENGDRYLTPTERAEAARQETEIAKQQAEAAKQQAKVAKQQAKVAKQQAETAEKEKAALRQRLLALGIDPDS